jgi:hypothetical protein
MVGTPGERCSNTWVDNRFTCPECLTDHEMFVPREHTVTITCTCGAILDCRVEYVPEAVCTIADPDEGEEG